MPARPREIIDGQLKCSKCKHPRPVSWYAKDEHAKPLCLTYRCHLCRPTGIKTKITDPDYDVIDVSKVNLLPRLATKMAPGSWERVVQRAMISTPRECVVVYVGKSYLAHYAAYMGVLMAARHLKVKLRVQHGAKEVYVTRDHSRSLGFR